MVIREFGAIDFRNYRELHVGFADGINLFVGGNGEGKTNLAEGIYFLSHLASFRGGRLEPLIRFGERTAWLQGTVTKGGWPRAEGGAPLGGAPLGGAPLGGAPLGGAPSGTAADGSAAPVAAAGHEPPAQKARVEITRRGRRAWLDDAPIPTLSAYAALFYAVLFNPDSLYNYRHYPAARRGLYDRFLSFLERVYLERLREFRTLHLQKNGLLKSGALASLPDWNRLFVDKASDIIRNRVELTERLNERLPALFTRLTGRQEVLELTYEPSLKGEPAADVATLERVREQEVQAGHALYGPHRDDFRLVLAQRRSEHYFSQGEYRIALLTLKLALNELLRERRGFRPVIILDDLFSELDAEVQERLVDHLRTIDNQIFITTTQAPAALNGPGVQIMEIREGRIA